MSTLAPNPSIEIVANAPTTVDAFLAWTATLGPEHEDYRYELSHGRVTKMMVNVSRAHSRICTNLVRILLGVLDANTFDLSQADFGVRTGAGLRSPDIVVERYYPDLGLKDRAAENPIFIAEVLSPSTTAVDFLEKLPEYTSIETLQTYLICSQDEPCLWLMARDGSGSWPKTPLMIQGRDACFTLGGLDCELSLSAIYHNIT